MSTEKPQAYKPTGREKIAKILPDISQDKEYDYLIPHHMEAELKPGCRVSMPFGPRKIKGYVVKVVDQTDYDRTKVKAILENEGHFIPEKLMKLGEWISDYYCASRIHTIRSMLPAPVRKSKVKSKKVTIYKVAEDVDLEALIKEYDETTKLKPRAAVLRVLQAYGEGSSPFIRKTAGVSASPLQSLLADGTLTSEEVVVERDPFGNEKLVPTKALTLTDEQEECMKTIHECIDSGEKNVVLIQGVTGCGKTEVYLQAIQHCLDKGQQAIVLVPEISLTPQTNQRFRARFGDRVSVLHSRLSDGERYDQWMQIHEGRTTIVVGARSALFAPFRNLGLIVVDEEHESSYKQDKAPRYHARDVSVVRAAMEKCTVLLGSATPSFESLNNAKKGKYKLSIIKKRADNAVMPKMRLIDMRNEASSMGSPQIFSQDLIKAIRQRLDENMQTILFLNRRGYATQMQCLKCGHVASCDDCSCTFTYHRKVDNLSCHFCGTVKRAPERCPECKDPEIKYTGLGTEKIESLCNGLFPQAKVARMDSDTMTRKDDHKNTLDAFQAGEFNILIGTQMIAKGLHFPKVTLVGVIFADLGLHVPDFRAAERTFQLLTQVSGRAGRGAVAGEVLVQSYTPFHPALQYSMTCDTDQFYEEEIIGRQLMNFPPYRQMAVIYFRGFRENEVCKTSGNFHKILQEYMEEGDQLMPAIPCSIARIKTMYRFQITILSDRIVRLTKLLKHVLVHAKKPKSVEVYVDIDPQSVM
ncbi:MAG: primosomal protein N' [Lentisphaeraceae bacterium]|nr:primosomal protein N' [Lentisphaeraceae bacterium]